MYWYIYVIPVSWKFEKSGSKSMKSGYLRPFFGPFFGPQRPNWAFLRKSMISASFSEAKNGKKSGFWAARAPDKISRPTPQNTPPKSDCQKILEKKRVLKIPFPGVKNLQKICKIFFPNLQNLQNLQKFAKICKNWQKFIKFAKILTKIYKKLHTKNMRRLRG